MGDNRSLDKLRRELAVAEGLVDALLRHVDQHRYEDWVSWSIVTDPIDVTDEQRALMAKRIKAVQAAELNEETT